MNELKNWTLVSKAMKNGQNGVKNYLSYLLDKDRHKHQILTNISEDKALNKLFKSHSNFELQKTLEVKKNKGGRPSNVGWSVVMSYPFSITESNFKMIKYHITHRFYEYVNETEKLNMNEDEIKYLIDSTIGVIHSGKNINNHIHLIFNKIMIKRTKNIVFKNEKKLQSVDLTKKKYTYKLKQINDDVIEQLLNINKVDYSIKFDKKPQKKRKSKVSFKLEEVEKYKEELKKREEIIEKKEVEIQEREEKTQKLKQIYINAIEKTSQTQHILDDKVSQLDIQKEELIKYTQEQFEKDLELHKEYMIKGMTQKADKLEKKIEKKIGKSSTKMKI